MTGLHPPVLELREVTVTKGSINILDSVSLRLNRGEHTAIIGPNGSGKSTLIKVIAGQLYPSAPPKADPPVRVFGRARWNVTELRSRLGIVSADLHQRFVTGSSMGRVHGMDAVTASFFGSEVIFLHHEVPADYRRRALASLTRVGAASLAEKRMHEMSSGEVRRVLIARALVHEPEVLVLDEPTTGLDLVARRDFLAMLGQLASTGTTLILVTHHVEEILPKVERVLVMRRGRIVADGAPDQVLTSEILSAAYDSPVALRKVADRFELSVT